METIFSTTNCTFTIFKDTTIFNIEKLLCNVCAQTITTFPDYTTTRKNTDKAKEGNARKRVERGIKFGTLRKDEMKNIYLRKES